MDIKTAIYLKPADVMTVVPVSVEDIVSVFFPSFSAGWRVSEEAFFTQAKNYVSNLKLRLSYGSLGNQKTVGYYDYLQLINTGAVMNYAFGDTTKGDYAYEVSSELYRFDFGKL